MRYVALLIGKICLLGLRLFGRRGAALPGLLVERIYPRFLASTLTRLDKGVIVITGTNGKTTTTRLATAMLQANMRVLTNPTGSNFTRGIVASVVEQSTWRGKLHFDIAVIELDEAYAVHFVKLVRPRGAVLLNVMRDQMDRFAEIDHTARLLKEVAQSATEFVLYNADDPRVVEAVESTKAIPKTFAVDQKLRSIFVNDDELHSELVDVPKHTATRTDYTLQKYHNNEVKICIAGTTVSGKLTIEGAHNALNATAALGLMDVLGVDIKTSFVTLQNIHPAFGRGEHIFVNDKKIVLQLVKNPSGFRHVLRDIGGYNAASVLLAINDDYADGRDVSWLWDVSFHVLGTERLYTSGTRAHDMALRVLYDGCEVVAYETSIPQALRLALEDATIERPVIVYATYTAMLELRKYLSSITKVMPV